MRVLWLCNIMLPAIARQLKLEASNKEGWISGIAGALLGKRQENAIELSVAFPLPPNQCPRSGVYVGRASINGGAFDFYGFSEDATHPECYEDGLEGRLKQVIDLAKPDIVHCFGTEYPHTLAMCRVFPEKKRIVIGLQGLCSKIAEAYFANLPPKTIHSITLRDFLRRDSLVRQQEKFVLRGNMEREAMALTGNIIGRTQWDRTCTQGWNPEASYYNMNEILRPEFYGFTWEAGKCIPHSIFLSQGDYPLKGLHYMLLALPHILAEYPDAGVYVAGSSLVSCRTLKQRLKLSAYGKYLRRLIKENNLEKKVEFLGRLDAEQMRDRYLRSSLYVCCSSLENSPNSLGEAMMLGMPCVSADVGGIPSLFADGEDGILYECHEVGLENISRRLAHAVLEMWSNPEKMAEYCKNARSHAMATHDREKNYGRLMEIYRDISRYYTAHR